MNSLIQDKLEKISKSEFGEKCEIKVGSGTDMGDGYLGNYFLVEMKNNEKSLELFLKSCQNKGLYNQMSIVRQTFTNEMWWYDQYFPTLLQFQHDRNIDEPFDNVPKFYGGGTKEEHEYIIFENIKSNGYKMYDRTKEMNEEHLLLIFKTVARYHAAQFAFKDLQREKYNKMIANTQDALFNCMDESGFDKSIQVNIDTYFETCGNQEFPELCEKLRKNTMGGFNESKEWVDDYFIITQADLWCNNMMFKYRDNHPIDVKIFDFQLIRPNSPVCDLSLFFYTLCSQESLDNFNYYFEKYYEYLSDRLYQLGSNPKKVFPYAVFKEHWKKYARYGFSAGFLILKVMLARDDEVRNVNNVLENGGHMSDTFVFQSKGDVEFNERMTRVYKHLIANDFI